MTELLFGDVIQRLRSMRAESIDGVLTDPSFGIRIQGFPWDGQAITDAAQEIKVNEDERWESPTQSQTLCAQRWGRKPGTFASRASAAGVYDQTIQGNRAFQSWCTEWGRELIRVVKPGGFLLGFGSTRTHHRFVCGLEDAGWRIRDTISWVNAQGFPKGLDIGKAIDERLGAERKVLGFRDGVGTCPAGFGYGPSIEITSPATQAAKHWDGYKTALKPAQELVVVAMKPCEGSFASNAFIHSVAGLNIDDCRVGRETITQRQKNMTAYRGNNLGPGRSAKPTGTATTTAGRYPSNVIFGHHPECELKGSIVVEGQRLNRHVDGAKPFGGGAGHPFVSLQTPPQVLTTFDCHPDCPVGQLGDRAQYFFCPKPSKAEKNAGLDTSSDPDVRNNHPTVKPIELTTYLAQLILPPARHTPRKLLVPFCGSGSEII